METGIIHSLKELQLKMPAIIKQYGSDNNFTQIALANPILALEKTGLTFTDEAKAEIEAYVRFGKEDLARYVALKEKIDSIAGSKIDLANNDQVVDAVIRLVGQPDKIKPGTQTKKMPDPVVKIIDRDKLASALKSPPKKINDQWQDSLAEFKSDHPIVPLLMEFRQMESERTGFAQPKDMAGIEEKLRKSPFTNVVFSLKRNNTESPKNTQSPK